MDPHSTDVKVDGIKKEHTRNIGGIITLQAPRDKGQVHFIQQGSTFDHLAVQADNGVVFSAELTADGATGTMILNGDLDESNVGDASNKLEFVGIGLFAKAVMTLQAKTGKIQANGPLTLQTGAGLVILNNLEAASDKLVFNSDYDSEGDGTLTIVALQTVSTAGEVLVTAWDIDLQAGGGGVVPLHCLSHKHSIYMLSKTPRLLVLG